MKEVLAFLTNWGGFIALLALVVIGIIRSFVGASTPEERHSDGMDPDHYVLRQPKKLIVQPLILLGIGVAAEFVLNFIVKLIPEEYSWISIVLKLVVAALFGLMFWKGLANIIRRHLFISEERIVVTPAFGRSIETTFSQIRTVANKMASGGGVIGKKIRTKEGKKFEVINSMTSYDHFCEQLDSKVELPNLTRRLFKGKDRKTEQPEEVWEPVSETPVREEAHRPAEVKEETELPSYAEKAETDLPSYAEKAEAELPSYAEKAETELPSYTEKAEAELPAYAESAEAERPPYAEGAEAVPPAENAETELPPSVEKGE